MNIEDEIEKIKKRLDSLEKQLEMTTLAIRAFNNHPEIEDLRPGEVVLSSLARIFAAAIESGKFHKNLSGIIGISEDDKKKLDGMKKILDKEINKELENGKEDN